MKRAFFAASLVLLVAASAWTQDAKPNFSGTWNFDAAKSDFGPAPPPDSLGAVIDHKEPNVKITITQKSAMGDLTNERVLTTDGKENVNKARTMVGDQEMKSTSRWDGKKLLTTAKMDMQGTAIVLIDSWELSDDGKVLTIAREIRTDQGDFATKIVYNKQ
jgi:hypothetical protein